MTDLEKVSRLPQDERVLLMPLVRTTRVFWIWAVVMAAITLWGGYAYLYQLRHGLGATGLNTPEYWGIYKRLFERQTCLSCEGPVAIASDEPDQQARLRRCADDPQTRLLVNTDRSEASLHGIRATPTFVIGPTISADRHRGEVVEGAMPWPAFQRLVDEALRKTGHPIDTSTDGR